jgi:hypothetical protein
MLKTWITNKQLWTKRGDPCTHVFMDGGRFKIESENVDAFNNIYCESIRNREKLCVVELRSRPKFNFFIDVDFMNDKEMSQDVLADLCDVCFSCVNTNDTMVVCITNPREKDGLMKTGIHMHWNTLISEDEVDPIINTILFKLNKNHPQFTWKDFIDTSVYRGGGLRMKWSHKYQNKTYYDPYIPALEYTKEGSRTLPQGITPWLLSKVSIRDLKSKPIEKFTSIQQTNQKTANPKLQAWIRANMKHQNHAQVLCLYVHPDCIFVKTDSRCCQNIKREHKSNHIYFYIDLKQNTICQRCFDEGCQDFQSNRKKIPLNLIIEYKPNVFGNMFKSPKQAVLANFERKASKHYCI